ncbi:phosphodiester glycosidase family protein [Streptomyces sp. NPDC059637]|uniref:phosphodiester glycosidase family protein n=1 Tax=Streptomyces sp. NPDC059637 TaxID=3347752 RepID=UPI0036844459
MPSRPSPTRPARRAGVAAAAVAGAVSLLLGAAVPAQASGTVPDPAPRTAAEVLRSVAPPPASAGYGGGDGYGDGRGGRGGAGAFPRARAVVDGDGVETARSERPVAPGVSLTSYDRLESDKWLRVDALSVDLGAGVAVDHLSSGLVSERRTVSEAAAAHDAGEGRRTVAAVNADFFDINRTDAPLGPALRDGRVVNSPTGGATKAVGIGPGGAGRVLDLYFEGTVTLPGGERPLAALNAARVPAGGIGAYTAAWGPAGRAPVVDGAAPDEIAEAAVRDGRVVSVTEGSVGGPVPAGTTVLVGREAGAAALAALEPGDEVTTEYRPRTGDGGAVPRTAVGGRGLLVVDGVPQDHEGRPNNAAAPRTAVGFSRDGTRMQVVTVDGRQADSGGVTLTELAVMMKEAGSYSALNLDGGGSSTMVAGEAGSEALRVENSPSDGGERAVPNGLALTVPEGSGRVTGFRVGTAVGPAEAPTVDPVRGGRPERVFPGLTRRLSAVAHDETWGPVDDSGAARPRWRATRPDVGRVDDRGVFTARRGGSTRVVAELGRARGGVELTVLDDLARVVPTVRRLGLAEEGASGSFGIVGLDAHGTSAPVEPGDVELEYDRSLLTVRPDGSGGFSVTARAGKGAGTVRATVAGASTVLAVTVGLEEVSAADFDDADAWSFSAARASGSLAAVPDGRTGTGLRLDYDFTASTATRAAYAAPPRRIPVDGQPRSFGLWVKGDGKGAWPTLHLKDAAGSDQLLRGPYVTWTGWRQVEFAVPAAVAYPVSVHRFYLAETSAAKRYAGSVVLDDLTARVPPAVDLPAERAPADPLVDTAAEAEGRDWRYAVMSDAQFVARAPGSAIVERARRTLREIRAAGPDLLLVAGDLVDEGSPADLAFARSVLEEELDGAVPWVYVPGNHEVMGGGIGHFEAEFGPARRVLDHRGNRFVTLDTSSLTLRGGGVSQVRALVEQLEDAARDKAVRSVTVVQHVPPRDPTGQDASRLTDRKEAALLERLLADFRWSTGKGAVFVGAHAGVFDASRVDGVPYLVNGNSGKAPSGPADRGGFTGWSLVGVDEVTAADRAAARARPWAGGPDWVSVQTRAHVDGLRLTLPERLAAGRTAPVAGLVVQGQGEGRRTVPVAFPLSADWSGSPNLHVGDVSGARPRHAAVFDPATGTLTALREGTVVLALTVNGTTRRAEVAVTASAAAGTPAAAGAA